MAKTKPLWKNLISSQGVEHEKSVFMRFSRIYLVFGSDSEPLSCARLSRGSETAPFWSQFSICYGLVAPFWSQILFMASKVMPFSRLGFPLWHQKWCHFEYLLTYSQWERSFLSSFQKISPQPYTATFGAEKRSIFRNFFKKCSHPSTARFGSENGHTLQKKFP